MLAALGRGAHLLHHGPRALLQDWLAWPLLGADADPLMELGTALLGDDVPTYATWLAARARLSEDWAAASGCEQVLLLGAGLDSSAWRRSHARVFEVDHPATQAWKRARAEKLQLPEGPLWVPVDFEGDRLGPALDAAGLDPARSTFVSWQGVIPYLTEAAILATLRELPSCSLALSYVPPEADWDADARRAGALVRDVAASEGEPWITFTTPAQLADLVRTAGFRMLEDVGAGDIEGRFGHRAVNFERICLLTNAG